MSSTEIKATHSPASDTREHLLDAAEQLIGDQGVDRASIRSITELAEANIAAVSYHFGSKNGLVREVFERRLRPINQQRLEMLESCLAESGPPDLESIVRAFVVPPFRVLQGEQASNFGRCLVRVLSDPGPETRDMMMEVFAEVIGRFTEALHDALPDAATEGIFWRFHFMVGAMAYTLGMGHLVPEYSRGVCDTSDVPAIVERLVQFVTSGMHSGPTGSAS